MATTSDRKMDVTVDGSRETGPWEDTALADPTRMGSRSGRRPARKCLTNPWSSTVLPRKTVELVGVAVTPPAPTSIPMARAATFARALRAGASREEILLVLKMAWLMSIHSCSLAAPILLEEAKAAGVKPSPKGNGNPDLRQDSAMGQWNDAWDPFFELDPVWTEPFIATGAPVYVGN